MSFMADPSKVFRRYLKATPSEERWYQYGMLAMSLEIITRIKVLESLPVTTEIGRQESITVLYTMLREIGIEEIAFEWYDKLSEWRKPKLRRQSLAEQLEHALEGDVFSDVPGGPLRPGIPRSHASLIASEHEARQGEPSPGHSLPAVQLEHRSPDAKTTSEQAVSTSSAWQRRHSG